MSFFFTEIVDEWGTTYEPTTWGNLAIALIMLILLLVACFVTGKDDKTTFKTKPLVFSAMAIALGYVTSLLKFFDLPMGGSITLCSMLFIVLIGYWYGLRSGIVAAIAYGLLQLITNPYVILPAQLIVDYILAFGALGLSGLFSKAKNGLVKGYIVAVLGRYLFAFISGYMFFGEYASYYDMNSEALYSLAYNGMYLIPEAIITIIVISIPPVAKGLARIKDMATS
jgi:thiamine transporter